LPQQKHNHKFRALALAFLIASVPAAVIGIVETFLTLRGFPPSLLEVLYGVNIHLIWAFFTALAARLVFWNLGDRAFPPVGIAAYFLVELPLTGAFWMLKSPLAPPISLPSGKMFAAATIVASLLIGAVLILIAIKRMRSRLWSRWVSGRPVMVGAAAMALLVMVNGFFVIRHYVFVRPLPTPEVTPADSALPFKDVIIILVDTLRRDHLSCFGYERSTSANIDRFAGSSYVFDIAYTPSNKTVPTVGSLFTGLYPSSHQITGPFQRLPEHLLTMAEQYRNHGYDTAAFVANRLISVQNGYDRGFDTFFPPGVPWWCYHGRTGLEILMNHIFIPRNVEAGYRLNQELFEWLDENRDGPRFIYMHYMEPHHNYAPPAEDYAAVAGGIPRGCENPPLYHAYSNSKSCIDWQCLDHPPQIPADDINEMIAGYDGEIHAVDRYIGEVFDELRKRNLFDTAHIVFLTDHGEEFGDHGGWFHGHSIYEELTRSPFVYRPPGGIAGGTTIARPVSQMDFFANLFALTGVEPTPSHQGTAIPELQGQPPDHAHRPVISSLPPYLYSFRWGPWKLIRRGELSHPSDLLFDLYADPLEQNDLAQAMPDTLDMLVDYLEAILAAREAVYSGEDRMHMDPEMLKKMRSLGYVE
jgi:arylsulfatase A-like enzyme